jgi:phage tail sheath protein FI
MGDTLFHLSTLQAARCMQTDADNGGIPFVGPSNKTLPINGIALADGTEVVLDEVNANALNDAGIVTAINSDGWRSWGNRTACYPSNTDPAFAFIPTSRMRVWNTTVIILSHKKQVDDPTNRRLIDNVVDSENDRLNGLAARSALLGGRVSFDEALNPISSLADGQCVYTFKWAPPTPAQGHTFRVEYDVTYYGKLFA